MRPFGERKIEYWWAAQTTGFGLWLSHPAGTLDSPAFAILTRWLPEYQWALLFTITGMVHLAALFINGRRWWTPFVRAGATSINALSYAGFAAGFAMLDPMTSAVYTYGFSYGGVAAVCIYSAMKDSVIALERRFGHG